MASLRTPVIRAEAASALIAFGYRVAQARIAAAGLRPEQIYQGDCGAAAFGIAAAMKRFGVQMQLAIGHQVPADRRLWRGMFEAPTHTAGGVKRSIWIRHGIPVPAPAGWSDPLWVYHAGLAAGGRVFDSRGELGLDNLAPEDCGYERGAMVSVAPAPSAQTWRFIRAGTEWMVAPTAYEASVIQMALAFDILNRVDVVIDPAPAELPDTMECR